MSEVPVEREREREEERHIDTERQRDTAMDTKRDAKGHRGLIKRCQLPSPPSQSSSLYPAKAS